LTLWQEAAEEGGSRIAVIHHRFYDLAGWKATPISDAGKKWFRSVSLVRTLHEKAWLTFSGYQSLIEFAA
ncbi:hypothetical protein, partial [Mesorhizobium sp. M3A.F.Ca.ET.174.01.1.1]|uniref:hypothetical protein n=1 Tax=Mesorhizobium sp. M3A.F.Ca.ET.174.01.1.1 TaxID=2563944 RepID=UPI001AEECC77